MRKHLKSVFVTDRFVCGSKSTGTPGWEIRIPLTYENGLVREAWVSEKVLAPVSKSHKHGIVRMKDFRKALCVVLYRKLSYWIDDRNLTVEEIFTYQGKHTKELIREAKVSMNDKVITSSRPDWKGMVDGALENDTPAVLWDWIEEFIES